MDTGVSHFSSQLLQQTLLSVITEIIDLDQTKNQIQVIWVESLEICTYSANTENWQLRLQVFYL